ncbi:MAG TPA: ribonuclease domain-containing protein [Burkholderiales bacterium]|nr:ribonuclease domain-containing protein [Burkholderiales bacterium]
MTRFRHTPAHGLWEILLAAAATLILIAISSDLNARSTKFISNSTINAAELPVEARETLALIHKGGPFPFKRDGSVFANREGRLPFAPRNAYLEYTVPTPGGRTRGARRIIARDGVKFWYTPDHYRTFRRILE